MGQPQPIELRFPAGGVARSMAYQWQGPFTTPNALNVWPNDTLLGRERGGQRDAFRIAFAAAASAPVNMLQSYRYVSSNALVEGLMAAGGGDGTVADLYYDNSGSLSVTSNGTAATVRDGILHGRQRGQLFFVADHSRNEEETTSAVLASGSNGSISSSTTFDSASYSDWEALGVNEATLIADYCVVLTGGDANVRVCTVGISAVPGSGTSLTLATSPMITGTSGANLTFRVERCPKYLSSSSGNRVSGGTVLNQWLITDFANDGYVPSGNPLIELWRDRLVLAGGIENPRQWYMSRQGDPFDFYYSATDDGRAVTGATEGQKAGTLGDPIRALIAYSDETMLFGCSNSMHLLRGDPAYAGSIDLVSDHIGVIGQTAWCRTSDDWLVWVSQDGLYGMAGGGSGRVQPISREKLPEELRNLSAATYRVVLAWDFQNNGIHISVTNKSSGSTTGHWFLDWGNKGWWPVSFGEAGMAPYCASTSPYYASSTKSSTLFGCRDGIVRQYDSSAGVDQGNGT